MNLPPSKSAPVLSSKWDGLSPHLLASFFEVDRDESGAWKRTDKTDPATVMAPLTEASMEVVLNWQSPFESAGPETKAPALMSMLSSGALQPIVDSLQRGNNKPGDAQAAQSKSAAFLKQFEGRTGITQLNSTQVFSGMPPVKIQVVALFRAWQDPGKEVVEPVEKLMEWALPVELAADGSVLSRLVDTLRGNRDAIEVLMPSRSPVRIAMKYKGRTYCPMVIESIGQPLDAPINKDGLYVEQLIPMTLCSLTALDRKLWAGLRTKSAM